jgi:V/A-type H+-transporting ATPase subunit C
MKELSKYSFANAKIRAMLSYLIDPAAFNALLEVKDIYELIEGLKKTPYKIVIENIDLGNINLQTLEKEFLAYDLKVYRKVQDALSTAREKDFVGLLRQRYELEELKVILRIWHKKLPVIWEDYIIEPNISFDIDFKKIISSQTIEEIILLLDQTPYKMPLLRVKDKFKDRNSTFYLEAALDVDYYKRLVSCIEKFSSVDKRIAQKILAVEIDVQNINWLIRLRKYYSLGMGEMLDWVIPGGQWINKETVRNFYSTNGLTKVVESVALGPYVKIKDLIEENAALIENFLYGFLLREVRKALTGFPFTIGTVIGYLILKHKETRNIISLFNAKYYGWKKEEIVSLLNI